MLMLGCKGLKKLPEGTKTNKRKPTTKQDMLCFTKKGDVRSLTGAALSIAVVS